MITKVTSEGNIIQYPLGKDPVTIAKVPPWNTTARSSSFSTKASDRNMVDTTSGWLTATLPLSPVAGDVIEFFDAKGQFGTFALTLGRNGNPINGLTSDFICDIMGKKYVATYIDNSFGWSISF